MKRTGSWLIGAGCIGVVVLVISRVQSQESSTAVAEPNQQRVAQSTSPQAQATPSQSGSGQAKQTPASGAAPAGEEKIVFTFDSEERMREFTKLWQQRQVVVVRMTVLQSYWNQEQKTLADLNSKLTDQYKLDISKNYMLDAQRRVLIEQVTPPAPAAEGEHPASQMMGQGTPEADAGGTTAAGTVKDATTPPAQHQ